MSEGYCLDCKSCTPVVLDHKAGDVICSECGLVLESHLIDETAEWRYFADESDNNIDPNRVGSPSNLLLSDGCSLVTFIANRNDALNRWTKKSILRPSNSVDRAFKTIAAMSDNLGLVETIENYAKELYEKSTVDVKFRRIKNSNAVMAACLYLACQEEGFPRTFKEIATAANGARMKEIYKAMELIKKHLEVGTKTIRAQDIARRFCCSLGLNHRTVKAVLETVQISEEHDIRRNSTSILAAAVYMITQLSEKQMTIRAIAQATEVQEATVRKAYKDLYFYASRIIPNWYAKSEDLQKLCVP